MDSENPYASPRYAGADAGPGNGNLSDDVLLNGARRSGKYLIVRREGELPALCRKCGMPASGPLRQRKLKWTNVWNLRYWASLSPVLVGYFVLSAAWSRFSWIMFVGLCLLSAWIGQRFAQSATVYFRHCDLHETRRRRMPWLVTVFAAIGATAFIAALTMNRPAPFSVNPQRLVLGLGACATIAWGAAILCAARISTRLEAYRIEGDAVWVKDLPRAFLARIPEISDEELQAWRAGD